jgi:putative thioredoxin
VQDAWPALEAAVKAAKGKVRMVKVDVDQNQRIAAQLRIQSIPTVYAFWQGQPVDGFQGAIPASEIKAFIDRAAACRGRRACRCDCRRRRDADRRRRRRCRRNLCRDPGRRAGKSRRLWLALSAAHIALGNLDQADAFLTAAPAAIAKAKELDAARAQLELARQAANAGPEAELRAAVDANPNEPPGPL